MPETRVPYQSFIGVNLHKNTVTLTAVDPGGETLAKLTISTKPYKDKAGSVIWRFGDLEIYRSTRRESFAANPPFS